jgi:hypothetical protein
MLLQLSAQSVDLFLHAALATPTPTATRTPPAPFWLPAGGGWGDPAIIAAIITSIASILVVVYQIWHTRKIEREKDEQQRVHEQEIAEQQRHHEQEMERDRAELQLHHEQEMERFRRSLDV